MILHTQKEHLGANFFKWLKKGFKWVEHIDTAHDSKVYCAYYKDLNNMSHMMYSGKLSREQQAISNKAQLKRSHHGF